MSSSQLKKKYTEEIIPHLREKFHYKSVMQVPRVEKICINKGIGEAVSDKKLIELGIRELTTITGQKAVAVLSKKAISNFKLREKMPIAVRVTLRKSRMFEFMERLLHIALPRVRDFRGVSDTSFDGRGNYTLGVKEQIIFPEISIDKVHKINGMDVTFVTSAGTDEESYQLLKALGMPFVNKN